MAIVLLGGGIVSVIVAINWSGISSSDARAVFGSLVAAAVCSIHVSMHALLTIAYTRTVLS